MQLNQGTSKENAAEKFFNATLYLGLFPYPLKVFFYDDAIS
jgi:hypothetical protein